MKKQEAKVLPVAFSTYGRKRHNKCGIVFGARFDENWQVVFDYADTIEGVKPFMGSKYVRRP